MTMTWNGSDPSDLTSPLRASVAGLTRRPSPRAPGERHPSFVTIAALVLVLSLLAHRHVGAQAPPLLSHSYIYATKATFRLSFVGEPPAQQATLLLQVNGAAADGGTADILSNSAVVTRDLSEVSFPPFAEVTYWWTYETPEGRWIETDKQSFRYLDNRYTWRTTSKDRNQANWIVGEPQLAAQVLETAEATLKEINAALQAPTDAGIELYIYPSEADLISALQLAGLRSVSGAAYPELGVVLAAVPPNDAALVAIQQGIPHELTHKALYDLLGAHGYASLPSWLDEGLATYFEARPDPVYAQTLKAAVAENDQIPLNQLCAPFPEAPDRNRLAYAQSGSVVRYLRQHYGWSKIRELLATYADGRACNAGVQATLGLDLAQLERDWRVWLDQETLPATSPSTWAGVRVLLRDIGPWLVLFTPLLLAPVLVLASGQVRKSKTPQKVSTTRQE